MEEFLNNLYANTSLPIVSALVLGLLTAISPCPMATNITAIGFIGKDIENRNRVFYNGLVYTLGRTFSYTALAIIIYLGADQFKISGVFQRYGEKIIGPLLVIIGIFMLGIIQHKFSGIQADHRTLREAKKILLPGCVFAGSNLCPCILPLQRGPLFWNVDTPDDFKLRASFAGCICHCYRNTGNPICLVNLPIQSPALASFTKGIKIL